MAWAYRASSQAHNSGVFNTGGSSNALAATMGAAVSAGNWLWCVVVLYPTTGTATPSAPTISDSVNGAWSTTAIDSVPYTDGTTHVYAGVFAFPNSAAGTPVVTVTSVNTNQGAIGVAAHSGLATTAITDGKTHAIGSGGNAASGSTSATTAGNELVFGVYLDDGWTIGVVSGAGTGFTERDFLGSNSFGELEIEDKDSGTSGTTQSAALGGGHPTGGTVTWAEFCIVVALAGGAPDPAPGLLLLEAGPVTRYIR